MKNKTRGLSLFLVAVSFCGSQCLWANNPPAAVSVTPTSGSGSSQTFSFVYSDPDGFTNLSWVEMIINSSLSGVSACFPHYDRPSNQLILLDDTGSGTAWFGPVNLGTANTLQNSQCIVNALSSSASGSGNNLTINLNITFKSAFAGAKAVHMQAGDLGNPSLGTGWQQRGTWTATAGGNLVPSAVSVAPSSGSGSSQTFSFVYSDPNGFADLSWIEMIINSGLSGISACMVHYDRPSNTMVLLNDAATGWLGSVAVGASATLENSQCIVNALSSSASGSGNNLTVSLNLTFKSAFAGAKNIYMQTQDNGGLPTGWQTRGAWTATAGGNLTPSAVSVTPSSGSGSSQTFGFVYSDPNGFANLSWVEMIVNSSLSGISACMVHYDPPSNTMVLLNDAATAWLGSVTLGTASTLENSQCIVNALSSSASGSGNNLTVSLNLTFKSAFAGAKNIYMTAQDNGGLPTGWQQRGTWTVQPPFNQPPTAVSVTPNAGGPGGGGTFSLLFSDPDGSSNLAWVEMGLDSTTDGAAGCYVKYDRAPNTISIFNDSGSAWSAPIVLGVPGTLSNSQCQVDAGASSFSTSGTNLTVNFALAFTAGFTGSQNIYMEARDMAGMDTGLLERGIYQVNACTGADFWSFHNVVRAAGNDVWAYGRSSVEGPKQLYWSSRVTSTEFLNGSVLAGRVNVQMNAAPGGIATNSWHDAPSVVGVGTYRIDSTHEWFSICGTSFGPVSNSDSLFVQRPTISGNNAFWYLGGAPSIDGYYTQTVLTANPNGAPEAPYWSATQNPSKISLTCSVCTVNTITSQAASAPGQSDVKVKVSVGGLESEEFGLAINTPNLLVYPDLVATGPHPFGPGYETLIQYKIRDLWGNLLFPITLQETFENWQPDWPTALVGWTNPAPTPWTPSQWLVDEGGEWFFADTLYAYDTSGTWVPQPRTFFGGLDKVKHATQKFFVGSGTPFNGKCVQRARAQYYTDHGELEGRASPVPAGDCQPGSVLP